MANSLNRMNIGHRTGPNPLTGFRVMPRGVEGFGNHGSDRPMWPRGATKGMVMPEHTAHVRIYPEPLPHVFHRHNVIHRMRILQRIGKRQRITADLDNPFHFLTFDIISTNQDRNAHMILLGIGHL